MTKGVLEVYNEGQPIDKKYFSLLLAEVIGGGVNTLEVSKANRILPPIDYWRAAGDSFESSASGVATTQILRYDLPIFEDTWLKGIEAHLIVFAMAIATTLTCELAVTYISPNPSITAVTIYDEILTTAGASGATNKVGFTMPSRTLKQLMAQGGLLTFVITVTAAFPVASTTRIYGKENTANECSFIGLSFSPGNTAKDTEVTNEKAAT